MSFRRTPYERLMARVPHTPSGECWEWQGPPVHGYSRLMNDPGVLPRNVYGHIVAYRHHKGDVPEGLFVLHSCDNRVCVNPDHLRAGTRQDNSDDKVSRERQVRGERVVHARMTAAKVLEIRERYATGGATLASLGSEYGIHESTVCLIVRRRTWKHI